MGNAISNILSDPKRDAHSREWIQYNLFNFRITLLVPSKYESQKSIGEDFEQQSQVLGYIPALGSRLQFIKVDVWLMEKLPLSLHFTLAVKVDSATQGNAILGQCFCRMSKALQFQVAPIKCGSSLMPRELWESGLSVFSPLRRIRLLLD